MKRKLCVVLCLFLAGSVFAKTGLGALAEGLSGLDSAKSEAATAALVEGRDIFPFLWNFVNEVCPSTDEKGNVEAAEIRNFNVLDGSFEYTSAVTYKYGLGKQCRESVILVKWDKVNFTVETLSSVVYGLDLKGNKSTSGTASGVKFQNTIAKSIAEYFSKEMNNITEEEYSAMCQKAYYNLTVQLSVGKNAPNKLKAKKWYEAHPVTGCDVDVVFFFSSLEESKKEGYEYLLKGIIGHGLFEGTFIYFYSNDDKYIDYEDNSRLEISGTVSDVHYSSGDLSPDYSISRLEILEKK